MRIAYLIIGTLALASGTSAAADKTRVPYEAIVIVDEGANVWSGPDSSKFYPTTRLKAGDRVRVIRHDPGNWCMIEPPAGSHGWVLAKYVDRDGNNRGFINANRVKVHVGSEINPESFTTYQAELSKDNPVEILGERVFTFEGEEPRKMLKIGPVKREWRWIKGKHIAAADSIRSEPFPNNESNPRKPNGPVADTEFDALTKHVSIGAANQDDSTDATPDGRESNPIERDRSQPPGKRRLSEIDREFHDMIQNEPPTWNLDLLEDEYEQLEEDVGTQLMSAEVARRKDAIKRYRKTYNEYAAFLRLTTETKQRDALLLAQQTQAEAQLGLTPTQRPTTTTDVQAAPANIPPSPNTTAATPAQPSPQTPTPAQQTPQFAGAGIVTKLARSFPGGPQFVLLAPDGRMLSILQPVPGVDLNRFNGRAMGIMGERRHRDDWNTDVITVRSLQPVQFRAPQ